MLKTFICYSPATMKKYIENRIPLKYYLERSSKKFWRLFDIDLKEWAKALRPISESFSQLWKKYYLFSKSIERFYLEKSRFKPFKCLEIRFIYRFRKLSPLSVTCAWLQKLFIHENIFHQYLKRAMDPKANERSLSFLQCRVTMFAVYFIPLSVTFKQLFSFHSYIHFIVITR